MQPELIAQISTGQLARNLREVRRVCGPELRICAALKANAYGHGVDLVAPVLLREGVEMAAVSTLSEAEELRDLGWPRPVLVLGQPFAVRSQAERDERLAAAVRLDLTPTLTSLEDARDLSGRAVAAGRVLDAHVNVDTGMGRMGLMPDEALRLCRAVARLRGLRLRGVYTHFGCAEEPDLVHTSDQLARFAGFLARVAEDAQIERPQCVHVANSSATLRGLGQAFDMVRVGLAVYGYHPSPQVPLPEEVRPILRLVSHLLLVKDLPAGHTVSYGATFVTRKPTRIGVVPIGYADGYLRSLSNRAVMTVNDHVVPVIGRVSMDLTVLDVTDVPDVKTGSLVIVLDHRADRPNSVESLAELMDTIPYELTCLLGDRIHRTPVDEFEGEPDRPIHLPRAEPTPQSLTI
ncbi:MAG: alanine racemase [Phycisphaerales bacterium]|nr:MAG: alanine racemase [Phycisphaerales bacterium]